jgi:hypothetical protein
MKNNRGKFPIRCIILLLTIANPFNSLAFGEAIANQANCDKAKIALLLKDVEDSDYKLSLEPRRPFKVTRDFSEIAQKHIPIDCDVAGLMIDLTDVGFKLSKTAHDGTYRDVTESEWKHSLKQPHFFASILLHQEKWFNFFPQILQIEIVYELGRVKLVKAIIIYQYL